MHTLEYALNPLFKRFLALITIRILFLNVFNL